MNITHANHPVYLDISPQDIQEITEQVWDTLRVLVLPDTKQLCIATGYGNTHTSMVYALRAHLQTKRIYTDDSIVYFEHNIAYVNDTCFGLGEKIPASKWDNVYELEHVDIIKLLCSERGLRLT